MNRKKSLTILIVVGNRKLTNDRDQNNAAVEQNLILAPAQKNIPSRRT
jgi:hypothetical protein